MEKSNKDPRPFLTVGLLNDKRKASKALCDQFWERYPAGATPEQVVQFLKSFINRWLGFGLGEHGMIAQLVVTETGLPCGIVPFESPKTNEPYGWDQDPYPKPKKPKPKS